MSSETLQETAASNNDASSTTTSLPKNDVVKPTLTADEAAKRVGVAPTDSTATRRQRLRAYWWFKKLLTISQFFDPLQIPNSFVNYQCIWWKAISGNDQNSPLYDADDTGGGLYYELLPPVTRLAVATPLATSFYPRYHHANVELRTYYLDSIIDQIVNTKSKSLLPNETKHNNIRLVVLGSGYDLRSIRMALKYQNLGYHHMDFIELDLPHVIEAKQLLFQQRLVRRRPELKDLVSQIKMFGVDLNDTDQVESILKSQLTSTNDDDNTNEVPTITIFVFEAILVYLDEGIPSRILSMLSQMLRTTSGPSSLGTAAICFADTLENVKSNQENEAKETLKQCGWELQDWITKPGKTNHLGWATLFPLSSLSETNLGS